MFEIPEYVTLARRTGESLAGRASYERIMDRAAAGRPCPACGRKVEKMAYLGGTCCCCPACLQVGSGSG
jgi:hypothetical protein